MNRFGAFGIHLGISLLIFISLGYVILFHWYPDFFFTTDGGWQGIRIVALVDLVLGPTLTLCVFKRGKPGLRTDLTLIGTFQAACLIAGTYVVYSERPIAIVYSDGYFHSMTKQDYEQAGQPVPELGHLPGPTPKWVTTALPEDPHAQSAIRLKARQDGAPLSTLSEHYKPFAVTDIDLQRDPQPIESIAQSQPTELQSFVSRHGGAPDDYVFFPLGARYHLAMLGLRKADLSVAGVLLLPLVPNETTSGADAAPA